MEVAAAEEGGLAVPGPQAPTGQGEAHLGTGSVAAEGLLASVGHESSDAAAAATGAAPD